MDSTLQAPSSPSASSRTWIVRAYWMESTMHKWKMVLTRKRIRIEYIRRRKRRGWSEVVAKWMSNQVNPPLQQVRPNLHLPNQRTNRFYRRQQVMQVKNRYEQFTFGTITNFYYLFLFFSLPLCYSKYVNIFCLANVSGKIVCLFTQIKVHLSIQFFFIDYLLTFSRIYLFSSGL